MFLLRAVFWLTLVILILPTGRGESAGESESPQAEPPIASDSWGAARATISDLLGFCERNPETCAAGSAALSHLGETARHGAEALMRSLAGPNAQNARSGGIPGDPAAGSSNTLKPTDLDVPWRGPDLRS